MLRHLAAPKEPSELEELRREAVEAQASVKSGQKLEASGKVFTFGKHAVSSAMTLYNSVSAAVEDPFGAVKDTLKALLAQGELFGNFMRCFHKKRLTPTKSRPHIKIKMTSACTWSVSCATRTRARRVRAARGR